MAQDIEIYIDNNSNSPLVLEGPFLSGPPALVRQVHDKLVTKTIQLFETFMVRFGVMLVGPTLGGKTARETQKGREQVWANGPMGEWANGEATELESLGNS